MEHYIDIFQAVLPSLLEGFWRTLGISLAGILGGSLIGFLLGLVRGQHIRYFTPLIGGYLHLLRGTPFLVQLYVVYFVLPNTGISLLMWDSLTAVLLCLAIYTSSYVTEIVSGAIRAIPRGQWEGAFAIGMRRGQTLWHIILPQSVMLILPSLGSVYVNLIKATSIVSVVGISELTRQGEINILRFPGDILFIYAIVAMIYFCYCFPVLKLVDWLEKNAGRQRAARKRPSPTPGGSAPLNEPNVKA
ncbi:amino acid ABC transporter permease [Nitratireductor pacificus]|uniref:Amino ABC transporter permease, 3-TM region, His/Glu/Gln/Arg/opine family domain-containing protein 14 n=1 Tax=Nitratireductor pacificus pht-3B TaxID=391937 RepID=K2MBQ1_9HYPH|nr:amino acid ABC transporter permease [Nitratireductor pacificus]EKF18305.1 amino ABC transporter permease, 3-TM region, His/Glu/Gln/Arg/opine family domain-containing protein 14 [Nitratireductor pacificus pht-3B]